MDARTFLRDYGEPEAELVAERAGTKLVYLKQIAAGHRRPSSKLAARLAEASGHRLDVMSLLFPPETPTAPLAANDAQHTAHGPQRRQQG